MPSLCSNNNSNKDDHATPQKFVVVKQRRVVSVKRVVASENNKNNNNDCYYNAAVTVLSQQRWCRILILELPIFLLLTISVLSHGALSFHNTYLHSYIQSLEWTPERAATEETYPRMDCNNVIATDLTGATAADLLLNTSIDNSSMIDQAVDKALLHGATMLPEILSPATAEKLRTYVLRRNQQQLSQQESISIIASEHRTSFALSVAHDVSVADALRQVGTNELVEETLLALLGGNKSPALMELQVITVRAGASDQYWHADTPPTASAAMYQYSFAPMYTLLIPLQDTDASMGPTAVCPGSHRCFYTPECSGFGHDNDDDNADTDNGDNSANVSPGFPMATNMDTRVWKVGHGLLYNSVLQHRGTRHVKGPDRVALVLTFASAPDYDSCKRYSRLPPLDTVYGIRNDHLGFTYADLRDPYGMLVTRRGSLLQQQWPWTTRKGWNSFRLDTFRTANKGQYRFRKSDLKIQVEHVQGVLGFLSVLLGVSVKDAPQGYGAVEYHTMRLLERMRTVAAGMAVLWTGVYVMIVVCLVQTSKRDTWMRLVAYLVLAFLGGHVCITKVEQTTWAQDVAAGRIASVPSVFESVALMSSMDQADYVARIASPAAQDVLVADPPGADIARLFAAQAHVLDYHTGNRRWRSIATQQLPRWFRYQGLPTVFRRAVVASIIEDTQTEAGHRFLRRNQLGDWLEMNMTAMEQGTVSLLLDMTMSHSDLSTIVFKALKAPCQRMKASSICRNKSRIMSILDPRTPQEPDKSTTTRTASRGLEIVGSTSMVKLHGRSDMPVHRVTETSVVAPKVFHVGQVIDCRSGYGTSRKWIKAKVAKQVNEWYYNVEYLELGFPGEKGVHLDYLRPVEMRQFRRESVNAVYRTRCKSRTLGRAV